MITTESTVDNRAADPRDPATNPTPSLLHGVDRALGGSSIVLPLLLVAPALLLLVFGTGLSILLSLLSFVIGTSGGEWENIGGLWLYILGIFAYVAGSFAAVLSPGLVPAIWRR